MNKKFFIFTIELGTCVSLRCGARRFLNEELIILLKKKKKLLQLNSFYPYSATTINCYLNLLGSIAINSV